jgi:arylsulfatase A-like enzyme
MNNLPFKGSLLLAMGFISSFASAEEQDKPNILFAMADDWGWPHAGAYGDDVVETPHFDQIAESGVLFQHAYISAPSSSPSRNAIITGQQFYRLGQGANLHSTLDTKYPNFMMILREAGYKIGHYEKSWGPGNYEAGGYDEHPCGPSIEFSAFMQEKPDGQPFCFWLGTSDPHRTYPDGYGDVPYEEVFVPEWFPEVDSVRKDIASYYYEVQRWDQRVGDALEALKEAGELDNTIIAMTGDHGWPFPRGKGNLYDYGARVPLAIQWVEEAEGGREVTDFVSLTDLAPTFLEAAGVSIPTQMTGNSLVQLLKSDESGRVDPQRNFVVTGRERHTPAQEKPSMVGYPSRAIRADGWLYIMNLRPDRWPAGVPDNATHPITRFADCDDGPTKSYIMNHKDQEGYEKYYEWAFAKRPVHELYDVKNDPGQLNNLAGDNDYHKVLSSLRNKLINYLRKTEDPRFTDELHHFNEYPYRTSYLDKEVLREMKKEQTKNKRREVPFR